MESKGQVDPSKIFARILQALNARNAPDIGRKLGITKQAVYEWQKNPPGLENLVKISKTSGASLHWLITGEGTAFEKQDKESDLLAVLDARMRRIVQEELASSRSSEIQELGTVDRFDIAGAVEKYNNALLVLRDWYAHDNVAITLPQTLDFQGWETMTLEEKVREIRGAREIMDHNRYLEERIEASRGIKSTK